MRIAVISVHGCPVVRAGEKDTGGMNVYLLETAKAFAQQGCQVDVYTRCHDLRDPEVVQLEDGARVIHIQAGHVDTDKDGVFDLLGDFTSEVNSYRAHHGLRYDLVWSHYWLSGVVGVDLQRRWGVPHVTSFHTLAELKRRALPDEQEHPERDSRERYVMRNADQIVVWSDSERAALREIYGVCDGRLAVIPPGVDSAKFSPRPRAASRRQLGLGDERLILYVGRLERLKGVDIVLKALATMEGTSDTRLMVVGGAECSPERRRLRSIASELGVAPRVTFVPSVDQGRLPVYYSAADVCVLPSYYESFGLAALEAAACGTPVVASRVGGLPSIVRDGETGYLVQWHCPGPFVDRLETILSDADLRERMGIAARARAEELTWNRSVAGLKELFGDVAQAMPSGWSPAAG